LGGGADELDINPSATQYPDSGGDSIAARAPLGGASVADAGLEARTLREASPARSGDWEQGGQNGESGRSEDLRGAVPEFSETQYPDSDDEVSVDGPEEPGGGVPGDGGGIAGRAESGGGFPGDGGDIAGKAESGGGSRGDGGGLVLQGQAPGAVLEFSETQYPDSADEDKIERAVEGEGRDGAGVLEGEVGVSGAPEFSETQYPETDDEVEVSGSPGVAAQVGGGTAEVSMISALQCQECFMTPMSRQYFALASHPENCTEGEWLSCITGWRCQKGFHNLENTLLLENALRQR